MFEVEEGTDFQTAITLCKEFFKSRGMDCYVMLFKEQYIQVSLDSNIDDLRTIYELKCEVKRLKFNN